MAGLAVYYLEAFFVVLIVTASYYASSRWLAPPRREEGEAVLPYACGEKIQGTEHAEPPYPFIVLLFAAVESLPVAVLVGASGRWEAFTPLAVAAIALPLIVDEKVLKGGGG